MMPVQQSISRPKIEAGDFASNPENDTSSLLYLNHGVFVYYTLKGRPTTNPDTQDNCVWCVYMMSGEVIVWQEEKGGKTGKEEGKTITLQ